MKLIPINTKLAVEFPQPDMSIKQDETEAGKSILYPALKNAPTFIEKMSFDEVYTAAGVLGKYGQAQEAGEVEMLLEEAEYVLLVKLLKNFIRCVTPIQVSAVNYIKMVEKLENVKVKADKPKS